MPADEREQDSVALTAGDTQIAKGAHLGALGRGLRLAALLSREWSGGGAGAYSILASAERVRTTKAMTR